MSELIQTEPSFRNTSQSLQEQCWPACGWRSATDDPEHAICDHSRVRLTSNQVTPAICASCSLRGDRDSVSSREQMAATVKKSCCGPSLVRKAWNLTKSIAAFLADGGRLLDESQYRDRLEICDTCDRRSEDQCLECGCRLSLKARGRAFQCPLKKWPIIESD